MNALKLQTERLLLEPLEKAHARAVFAKLQDRRIYEFFPDTTPRSLEELEARYEFLAKQSSPDGRQTWLNWLLRRKDNGGYIGRVEATVQVSEAVVGYIIFPEYWRQGYAKEACREMLRHLFEERGVERAAALMDTRNAASIRLAESLGLKQTARLPNADFFGGAPSDEFRYELKRRENV